MPHSETVGDLGDRSLIRIAERAGDERLEQLQLLLEPRAALGRNDLQQILQHRPHPASHLRLIGPIVTGVEDTVLRPLLDFALFLIRPPSIVGAVSILVLPYRLLRPDLGRERRDPFG